MTLEATLQNWTSPSSDTEQEKQDRTERMIREAVDAHPELSKCKTKIFPKGSYANNTNIRADSDVDIAVLCTECVYWRESKKGIHTPNRYKGVWTPSKLRTDLVSALNAKFSSQVDTSGSTAIRVNSSTARVDADVVPCFSYKYYFDNGPTRTGTKIFKRDGSNIVNYPDQQLANGRSKNTSTNHSFKKVVRILKRAENAMVVNGQINPLPSFLMECLPYNCPDDLFFRSTWTEVVRGILIYLWNELDGPEPTNSSRRMKEVNGYFFLFHDNQGWTREDARDFVGNTWSFLELE